MLLRMSITRFSGIYNPGRHNNSAVMATVAAASSIVMVTAPFLMTMAVMITHGIRIVV